MKNIPDIQQIEILILIVRHGSFRKAAKELNLSPPSLTSSINNLEEKLGIRVLNRSTRSLSLTKAGRIFLEEITPIFYSYKEAIDNLNIHREKPSGLVKFNLPKIVLDLFFESYFLNFKIDNPDIELELHTTDKKINIIDEGFDAGIRYHSDIPKDMVAIPIGEKPSLIPVCSPSYLREYGSPTTPEDLINFRCINRCFPSGQLYKWEFKDKDNNLININVSGDLTLDSDLAMIKSAEAGIGIAFVYESLVGDKIKNNSLVRLLPEYNYPCDNFCLYYPTRKYIPTPLKSLINWILTKNKNYQ
ncbi:LysR family transcriptional regulator [Vibrio viridaestus]|uniref:LysR family transcriptional regulator n=1 Tax=Vibrio viridaestus TaxID=2487322 RepID=A0A3N9TK85_9VIBR|nr:LysR family transcriptional regulator [Vibrio viridaestus]RQW64650.1 LysR family transcriptional regulator [Vibrio viridaestus]